MVWSTPPPPPPPRRPPWSSGLPPLPPLPPRNVPAPPVMPPRPPPPPPPSQGVGWAIVPVLTFGWGSPISFGYAAARARSMSLGLAGAGYAVGLGAATVLSSLAAPVAQAIGVFLFPMLWIMGSVHAFAVRPRLYPPVTPHDRMNQQAVEVAKHRRALRDRAREILAGDPALAREVGIGRPDVPRMYDDGGLVDINHAPAQTIALIPGLTDDTIQRIVSAREEQGGFVSAEELAVHADLHPDVVASVKDYAVFVP